jgi:hypothetical protein
MGDKRITRSGGKGAVKTEKMPRTTWCGSGRLGKSQSCMLGCCIQKGKSLKKAKQTRDNTEFSMKTLLETDI